MSRASGASIAAGPDAADVVYEDFVDPALQKTRRSPRLCRSRQKWRLAILDKYATDNDFREILLKYGETVIPPIAAVDANPETLTLLRSKSNLSWKEWMAKGVLALTGEDGQATIALISRDGMERADELNNSQVEFYQFLPLYDLVHLGSVLGRGHTPTSGEMTWALIDGCFVVMDALSLAALQPEGAAASEAARMEVRTATKQVVRAAGAEAAEEAGAVAGKSLARKRGRPRRCISRNGGQFWPPAGTYQLLRRIPGSSFAPHRSRTGQSWPGRLPQSRLSP